jgi:hypothetical protein
MYSLHNDWEGKMEETGQVKRVYIDKEMYFGN